MSSTPLRCAVIGVGHLGRWHAAKYALLPETELVAVADSNAETAQRVAAEHGCAAVLDHRELLGRVDAVSIAAPTTLHYPIARDFIDAGCHVLVEKPITTTVEEADALNLLANQHGVVLQVGHLERFNAALRRLLETPLNPRFIESHRLAPFKPRATDVSVVLDLMIHDIDIVLDLVNAPLIDLRASGAQILTSDIDIVNARLEFANGCVANLTSSRVSTKSERRMRIFQPHGYASIDFQNRILSLHHLGDEDPEIGVPEILSEELAFDDADALLAEIRAFVAAIRGEQPVVVGGRAGQRALEAAIRITDLVYSNLNVMTRDEKRPQGGG
ncbi:oxidoreductase, Gfo/Idh/MocA family, putative [Thioalkalivibrio nitratireducens DSM 14787]|uniref:Oxidoreductase, Gfo/Idh/MocA family, putative n=1 Tax=Thioalkalivibrio nitratireducens (strain DSM 14787 / UNIQEM 213 / ALEN2) TaxID=1255043 RepID=L0DYW8_THIND|nr:Gfo/Idh/MocA family oxidoreductase [Thioalkalivibrio nitratireducens]AGA33556.1 oxidoreductase, Gfo/Idh/MocA family, putative [Thioalkalivibrio nitratireducens DSM 14787]